MADKADIIVICGPTATGKTALSVALAKLLDGMICHVNLIPVNPVREAGYQKSGRERQQAFIRILERAGITATVRRTLGADINASCGQLRRKHLKEGGSVNAICRTD